MLRPEAPNDSLLRPLPTNRSASTRCQIKVEVIAVIVIGFGAKNAAARLKSDDHSTLGRVRRWNVWLWIGINDW